MENNIKEIKELDPTKCYFVTVDTKLDDKSELLEHLKKVKSMFNINGIYKIIIAPADYANVTEISSAAFDNFKETQDDR